MEFSICSRYGSRDPWRSLEARLARPRPVLGLADFLFLCPVLHAGARNATSRLYVGFDVVALGGLDI
jgi:hypothetical protein